MISNDSLERLSNLAKSLFLIISLEIAYGLGKDLKYLHTYNVASFFHACCTEYLVEIVEKNP